MQLEINKIEPNGTNPSMWAYNINIQACLCCANQSCNASYLCNIIIKDKNKSKYKGTYDFDMILPIMLIFTY